MVLFVDYNDVFRAPLAAAFYTQTYRKPAHSAGVYADEGAQLGDAVRPKMLDTHRARCLSASMLAKADAVWCVTAAIARHLTEEHPEAKQKIHALPDIPDPTGSGKEGYAQCEQHICRIIEEMMGCQYT